MFIEKTVHAIGRKYQVTVATSDGLEQVIIMGQGGKRLSAAGLKEEVDMAAAQMKEHLEAAKPKQKPILGNIFRKILEKQSKIFAGQKPGKMNII